MRALADEGGQALVLIAAAMAALLLGVGLALDTGQLFVARRAAQTAADAAAWAGATVLYAGGNASQAQTAATTDAARNGYSTGGFVTVTAVSPPASGAFAGDPAYIEVTIADQVATALIPGPTSGRTSVSVRAVAGLARGGAGEAVIVLRPTSSGTLNLAGNTRLTVSGGGTNTNSTSGTAVTIGGGGLLTGTYHRVTGGVSAAVAGRMSPAPVTGAPAAADPFATLAGPSTSGLSLYAGQVVTNATVTLNPGVYGGLVTVGLNGVARLNPGTYVFLAGLTTTSNGSLIPNAGGGTFLYNTYLTYPLAPGGSPVCGNVSLAGTGQHTLAARSSGSYAGMLLFQDRNCTNTASITVRTGTSLSGTLYAPAATLSLTVSNSVAITSQIVANQLALAGNNTLTMNFTAAAVAGARVPSLVE